MLRWFSVSATRHSCHPVVRAVKVTQTFDPEFQANKDKADTMLPWVPRKERGAARRALQRQRHRAQLQSDLAQLKTQLAPSAHTNTTTTVATSPQRPDPHPDPMVDYKQQFEYQCRVYAHEIAQKQRLAQEAKQAKQLQKRPMPLPDTTDHQEEQQIQAAVAVLEQAMTRAFKRDKILKLQQDKMNERKKAVLRLYKASHAFITPERLEEALDAFFAEEKKTHSLPLNMMQELALEQRRLKREAMIQDELSGSLDRSEHTVEEVEQRRAAERAALHR